MTMLFKYLQQEVNLCHNLGKIVDAVDQILHMMDLIPLLTKTFNWLEITLTFFAENRHQIALTKRNYEQPKQTSYLVRFRDFSRGESPTPPLFEFHCCLSQWVRRSQQHFSRVGMEELLAFGI